MDENKTGVSEEENIEKEENKKRLNKKKVIFISLIVVIIISLIAIIFGVKKIHDANKKTALFDTSEKDNLKNNIASKKLNEKQKDFLGITNNTTNNNISSNTTKIEYKKEENYTDAYKKYLELPDKEKEELEVIPREEEVSPEEIDDIKNEIKIEETIPEKFNLADKINLKVEDQGEYGLCWDFASMNSLETFLALHENKEYDFSEMHVDYITSELLFAPYDFFFYRGIHDGGNFGIFKNYLKLTGPVLEEKLPYKEYSKEEYQNFIDMDSITKVTKTVDFPSSPTYYDENVAPDKIKEYRDLIKSHIMKNGSIYAVTDANTINEKKGSDTTQYCTDNCWPDHAISIVGWDDNYSKENFANQNGNKPKNDGAYIALNSWGSNWGNNGYFYISYEDTLVELEPSGIISTSKEDNINIDSIKNEKIKKYLDENYSYLYSNDNGVKYLSSLVLDDISYVNFDNYDLTSEDLNDIVSLFPNLYSLDLPNNKITDISMLKNLKFLYYINLDNNEISDITSLPNSLSEISLVNNNISDISVLNSFEYLNFLDISNNSINWNENTLKNPNLFWLSISNTGFNNINYISSLKNLYYLDVSNNSLESLNGIENFSVDVLDISSNNQIKDFELLKKMDSMEYGIALYADNCSIQDISIFNDMNIYSLSLENNQIKDLSKFNNTNITDINLTNNGLEDISNLNPLKLSYINLSKNPKLKGLESIKNIETVILQHNEFTNLDEVKKLTNITGLDLSYNKIENYEDLNNLENLLSLSLEGNTGVKLEFLPKTLYVLNVKDCNLDNDNDLSKFDELFILNISGNNNFKNLKSISTKIINDYGLDVYADNYELSIDELQELKNVYFANLNLKYFYTNNNVKFEFESMLNKEFMGYMLLNRMQTNDILLNKNAKEAIITGENPTIKTPSYNIIFTKQN